MKDAFPEYYRHTQEDFDRLWSEGLLVLDTNALLNLYRYSEHTRDQLLAILKAAQSQLWMPHQVASEFLKRRLDVIHDKHEDYDSFVSYLNRIEEESKNLHRDGKIEVQESLQQAMKSLDDLVEELEKQKSTLPPLSNLLKDDYIWSTVEELYEGKLGTAFSSEETSELIKEGKSRYDNEVPPGYKDVDKQQNEVDKFGDLIVWKQILNKAKADEQPIIFVTDDQKDDWWWKSKGRTIGPRPELAREMLNESGQRFHMYTPDRFMSEAEKYLDHEVSSKAIDEAKALDSLEEEAEAEFDQEFEESLAVQVPSVASVQSPLGTTWPSGLPASSPPSVAQILEVMNKPETRKAREQMSSSGVQGVLKHLNSPEVRRAIKTLNSSGVQAAQRALAEAVNKGYGPFGKGL